jgi:type I restriction enzyme S subunit
MFDKRHVLYGRLRPYLNKVLVPDFNGHCSTEIFPILTNGKLIRRYLAYWLMSPVTNAKIDATWTGARMPRANMNEVIKFKLPVPAKETQKSIVELFDNFSNQSKQTQSKLEEQLAYLKQLKSSILGKAFKGEL